MSNAERSTRYWFEAEQAYAAGDPGLGDELAELAGHCEDWAREDQAGGRVDSAA